MTGASGSRDHRDYFTMLTCAGMPAERRQLSVGRQGWGEGGASRVEGESWLGDEGHRRTWSPAREASDLM